MSLPSCDDDASPLPALLAECLDLWEDRGESALEQVCAQHPEHADALRQRVDALRALGLLDGTQGAAAHPERIGSYRVLRVLGRGGMGVVYEAEQDQPRRRVAVKVLRGGLDSPALRARFAHEATLLARLQHPGIAQIYEAGSANVASETLPYFAMELVSGRPLTEFADASGLDARARLDLLARVCDAVQHAHQNGVIHRDLKPSNILVDGDGQPKLLDFGVARAVAADAHATLRTRQGQLVGTLAYMSPEQAAADPDAVDTRSDVYSLGVIAHEVLGGALPYDVHGLRLQDALRVISEQPPARLGAVDTTLAGDVETVVRTALAKEKDRRYASAEALAADLRRCLRDEPIAARAPTAAYTLRKFARRNRVLVASAAAVVVALALGLAGTLVGLLRARDAQAEAERRYRQAQAAVEFQRRMLAAAHPFASGRDARVADVVDRAARELGDGALADQPEVEGLLRLTIGDAYRALGLTAEASAQHARSLELLRRAIPAGAREALTREALTPEALTAAARLVSALVATGDLARARRELASAVEAAAQHGATGAPRHELRAAEAELLRAEGQPEEAVRVQRHLYDELRAAGEACLPQAIESGRDLADLLRSAGRGDDAVTLLRELVQDTASAYGERHARTLKLQIALATALQASRRIAESRALTERLLPLARDVFGPEQPETLATLAATGFNASNLGDHAAAETVYRDLQAKAEQRYGPASMFAHVAKNNLAQALIAQQKWTEAEAILRPLLATLTALRGPEHFETLHVQHTLGTLLRSSQRYDDAIPLLEQLVTARRRVHGAESKRTLESTYQLARCYVNTGRHDDAETSLRDAIEVARRTLAPSDDFVGDLLALRGHNLARQERFADAEPVLLEAHAWLARTWGADRPDSQRVARDLAALYKRLGKVDESAAWEARAGAQ